MASDPETNDWENQFAFVARPEPVGELVGCDVVGLLEGNEKGWHVGIRDGFWAGCFDG